MFERVLNTLLCCNLFNIHCLQFLYSVIYVRIHVFLNHHLHHHHHHHHHHHYICFSVFHFFLFSMFAWVVRFLMQDFFSLAVSLLTFLSLRPLLITSFHVSLCSPLGRLTLILKILHFLDQALSCILSRWPNHFSLPSCKHSLLFFNFRLVLSFFAKILSSGLTLHIYISILTSFLSSLITSSSLTGQVSLLYSVPHM